MRESTRARFPVTSCYGALMGIGREEILNTLIKKR